jgi:type VI secretion system protein ImpC
MSKKQERERVFMVSDIAESYPAEERPSLSDSPFMIVVLGDFRHGFSPNGGRRLFEVDRDNFDQMLSDQGIQWMGSIPLPGGMSKDVVVPIRQIDDFRPDEIVENAAELRRLTELHSSLENPSEFETAAAQVAEWVRAEVVPAAPEPAVRQAEIEEEIDTSTLLDSIVDAADSRKKAEATKGYPQGELGRFVQKVAAPHEVRVDWDRQAELSAALKQLLGRSVREILHDPGFQRLEAAWRTLDWLVHETEMGPDLKIKVLQVSKEELKAELSEAQTASKGLIHEVLLEPATVLGGVAPSLLIGCYEFDQSEADVALLAQLADVAEELEAPFLAGGAPALLGTESYGELGNVERLRGIFGDDLPDEWSGFRREEKSQWVGLVLPRFLLRLPYGSESDPSELFDFEEFLEGPSHDLLLWGHAGAAVACLIAKRYSEGGLGGLRHSSINTLDGLPLYVYREKDRTKVQPCAEILLTERMVGVLVEAGLTVMASYRDSDQVLFPRLQSVSDPWKPFRWD